MVDGTFTLNREQLALLRSATGVIFRTYLGETTIELLHESGAYSDPGRIERKTVIRATSNLDGRTGVKAFEYIQSAQFAPEWLTTARHLKPGEPLKLTWNADGHSNGLLRDANLHGDALELQVWVKQGKRTRVDKYELAHRVTFDNSARMIQGVPTPAYL